MKHQLLIPLIILVAACHDSKVDSNNGQVETLPPASQTHKQDNLFIKATSNYSKVFLDDLTSLQYNEPIQLIDDFIIVGSDTTTFPKDLNIHQLYHFKATKDNQLFDLMVKRINATTLHFTFRLYENNSLLQTHRGEAHLGADFFLAPEGDEDEEKGDGYGCHEYWQKTNNARVSLRIGMGEDEDGKKRAKITFDGNDLSKKALTLQNCPTLRTEK